MQPGPGPAAMCQATGKHHNGMPHATWEGGRRHRRLDCSGEQASFGEEEGRRGAIRGVIGKGSVPPPATGEQHWGPDRDRDRWPSHLLAHGSHSVRCSQVKSGEINSLSPSPNSRVYSGFSSKGPHVASRVFLHFLQQHPPRNPQELPRVPVPTFLNTTSLSGSTF